MGHIALEVDGARVAFTDRHGGVSIPPYDTANLGFATRDDPRPNLGDRGRDVAHRGRVTINAWRPVTPSRRCEK